MRSACPYCFTRLGVDEVIYRCTSGRCAASEDPQATRMAGYDHPTTPMYRQTLTETVKVLPSSVPCRQCGAACTQEVCPVCHLDLPPRWRDNQVLTVAMTGARGAGKSVYIAVAMEVLSTYASRRGYTVSPETTGTQEVYSSRYYKPLFHENKVMEGTPPISSGGAYQRDPLIWRLVGGSAGTLYLVIRDVAGEDIDKLAGARPAFSFIDRADLTIFLFDPLMLDSVRQVLSGIIPDIDASRLGARPGEVLPKILNQMTTGTTRLALTISKFDAIQQLPRAKNPMASVVANPAARFNQDTTMQRASMEPAHAAALVEQDSQFLDAEVRSLFDRINERTVTLLADQALENHRIADLRYFAVSAVGETPRHAEQLTERGISPFRVLDPLLWALGAKGFVI